MYAITMEGAALHHYGSSRYGWGPIDQCDPSNTKAERVHFDTQEKAQEWIDARTTFARGAQVEMIDPPKKRGRPATGTAMTAAERKAKQRTLWETKALDEWTITDCLNALGSPGLMESNYECAFERLMSLRGF